VLRSTAPSVQHLLGIRWYHTFPCRCRQDVKVRTPKEKTKSRSAVWLAAAVRACTSSSIAMETVRVTPGIFLPSSARPFSSPCTFPQRRRIFFRYAHAHSGKCAQQEEHACTCMTQDDLLSQRDSTIGMIAMLPLSERLRYWHGDHTSGVPHSAFFALCPKNTGEFREDVSSCRCRSTVVLDHSDLFHFRPVLWSGVVWTTC